MGLLGIVGIFAIFPMFLAICAGIDYAIEYCKKMDKKGSK